MPLTEEQVSELRSMIDERLRALSSEYREGLDRARNDSLGNLAGPAADTGDESVASLIQDLDQADASRDANEMRELNAARDRMASGAYGICASCGADISYARLRAAPGAIRCIRCQENYEKTHAGAGRPTL